MLSDDGSARIGPLLPPTIVIATFVKALIEPEFTPIVAELDVKVSEPKLASVVREQCAAMQSAGRSTIHSAELCPAPDTVPVIVYLCPLVESDIETENEELPSAVTDAIIASFGATVKTVTDALG